MAAKSIARPARRTPVASFAILLILAVPAFSTGVGAIDAVVVDVEPNGGDNDGMGKCDLIGTACAAAAAVALDGCVSGSLDASGSGSAVIAIFPAVASANVQGEITVCMAIATAQTASAMSTVAGVMNNYVNAHYGPPHAWFSSRVNENDRTCTNLVLDATIPCGPTGTTYSENARVCISAFGRTGANMADPADLVYGTAGTTVAGAAPARSIAVVGGIGAAKADAAAQSISCDDAAGTLVEFLQQSITVRSSSSDVQGAMLEAVMGAATEKVDAAIEQMLSGQPDQPMLQEMAEEMRQSMLEDIELEVSAILNANLS